MQFCVKITLMCIIMSYPTVYYPETAIFKLNFSYEIKEIIEFTSILKKETTINKLSLLFMNITWEERARKPI